MTDEQDAVTMAKIEQHMPEILWNVLVQNAGVGAENALTEAEINRHIIAVLTRTLDTFIGACMDSSGQPKAPDRQALMRARGYLPATCKNTLIKGEL